MPTVRCPLIVGRVWLYSNEDGAPVAWSEDGRMYFDVATGRVRAWRVGDSLYEPDGGRPLGWFDGKSVFNSDGKQLFLVG